MDPSWRNWQFPLRPRPSSQEAGPKAYPGQGHGMGLDGVPIDGPTEAGDAVGETVILLHPALPLVGVSIRTGGDVSKITVSPTARPGD